MPDRKSFALLIDSDNVSAKYIQGIMNELTSRHGQVTYRRIYGDWTSPQMGKWKDTLAEFSLTPMQQFPNTKGKNATDSFLIIDAMDILYEGKVDGFCIVSSDGDFTRLASRLRDAGQVVVGMGEQKTPRSFRAACSVFTSLEVLLEDEDEVPAPPAAQPADEGHDSLTAEEVRAAISNILSENSDQGRQTRLSEVGTRLVNLYPDFDVRSFGYTQLSKFIDSFDIWRIERTEDVVFVSLRDGDRLKHDAHALIRELAGRNRSEGISLSVVGGELRDRIPGFKVKDFGYSKLSKFIRDVEGVTLRECEDDSRVFRA